MGRQRFRIEEAWELDGYRMARPAPMADARPEPGSAEAAELEALGAQVTQLVSQWIERVRRVADRSLGLDPEACVGGFTKTRPWLLRWRV